MKILRKFLDKVMVTLTILLSVYSFLEASIRQFSIIYWPRSRGPLSITSSGLRKVSLLSAPER